MDAGESPCKGNERPIEADTGDLQDVWKMSSSPRVEAIAFHPHRFDGGPQNDAPKNASAVSDHLIQGFKALRKAQGFSGNKTETDERLPDENTPKVDHRLVNGLRAFHAARITSFGRYEEQDEPFRGENKYSSGEKNDNVYDIGIHNKPRETNLGNSPLGNSTASSLTIDRSDANTSERERQLAEFGHRIAQAKKTLHGRREAELGPKKAFDELENMMRVSDRGAGLLETRLFEIMGEWNAARAKTDQAKDDLALLEHDATLVYEGITRPSQEHKSIAAESASWSPNTRLRRKAGRRVNPKRTSKLWLDNTAREKTGT